MRAANLHAFGDLRIDEVPDPALRADDVMIEVTCVQPSVTEAMLIHGKEITLHDSLRNRLQAGIPIQFGGHEFAGVIREVGRDVAGWHVGDHVTAVETLNCGNCQYCLEGSGVICRAPEFIGFTRPGAFAELLAVPSVNLVRLPDTITPSQGAALQPLVGAIHAQMQASVRPGESVLVLGTGVMGLLATRLARLGGAGLIAATGRGQRKLELAGQFGADVIIDAHTDFEATTSNITGDMGFDVVIETAGGPASANLSEGGTFRDAVAAARYGGRIVLVSALPDGVVLPVTRMREKGISILHPTSGRKTNADTVDAYKLAVRMVERGDIDVTALITHQLEGILSLPQAIEMTLNKQEFAAINPPQVALAKA